MAADKGESREEGRGGGRGGTANLNIEGFSMQNSEEKAVQRKL